MISSAGDYTVDQLVEDSVLLKLKVATPIDDLHRERLNDLNASRLNLCLLLNFGNLRLDIRRLVRTFQGKSRTLRVRRDLRFHFPERSISVGSREAGIQRGGKTYFEIRRSCDGFIGYQSPPPGQHRKILLAELTLGALSSLGQCFLGLT
jgi:hypothetical protein